MGVCITTFFALKHNNNKSVDIFITLKMSSYVRLAKKKILQKLLQKANTHLQKSRKDAALGLKDSGIEMIVAQKMIAEIEEIIVSIGD